MDLLQNLGIDWRLLIAQLINFTILLAVLYKFLYKPVLKMLHSRSEKIEQGLKNADDAEKKLSEAAMAYEAKIQEGRKEAVKILETAKKEAEAIKADLSVQAHKETEKIVAAGRTRLAVEKAKIIKEAEGELIDLAAAATEHILGNIVTPDIDRKLMEQAVEQVKIGRA